MSNMSQRRKLFYCPSHSLSPFFLSFLSQNDKRTNKIKVKKIKKELLQIQRERERERE
jgi:hypothetical protein